MRFGSVCSGIEAASVAWHPLGWEAAWLSEIEPFPSAVLNHHYPDVPNLGDMTTLPDRIARGEVEAPDLFCGGTPCQAFSVAGLRKSLDDARGNLSLVFCEIANAIDTIRLQRQHQPAVIFWENVPGVLNTKDNAFGCFLGALAGEVEELEPPGGKWTNAGCVSGPTRTVAWRVLDAQYFGVAQRRRRVFVVASARTDFDPTSVLFELDGVRRDIAPSREAGKVAPTIPSRSSAGGGLGTDFDLDGGLLRVAGTLTANTGGMTRPAGNANELDFCIPVAFHPTQDPISSIDGTTHAMGCGSKSGTATVGVAYTTKLHNTQSNNAGKVFEERSPCLDANSPAPALLTATAVRRLTPVECERLQGFPDHYTSISWRGKAADACPDGPRYKALGNSWAVPNVRWIGARIENEIVGGLV
jgi:DNA (cytosine-5)-methyltransferase 1